VNQEQVMLQNVQEELINQQLTNLHVPNALKDTFVMEMIQQQHKLAV
jgi:hypothetical protein